MIGTAVATRHTSYGLKSLMGVVYGSTKKVIKGDTRSLDYSSYAVKVLSCLLQDVCGSRVPESLDV